MTEQSIHVQMTLYKLVVQLKFQIKLSQLKKVREMPLVLERVICSVNPSFATYSRVTTAIFKL